MEIVPKKKRKIGRIILLVILGILAAAVILVICIGNRNVRAMNHCIEKALAEISEEYTLTPLDPKEYRQMKVYGVMKFDVSQYDVEGIGNLSVMKTNVGVMQMSTLILTPFDKNLPMVSMDYMYTLGGRKTYFEFYDLVDFQDEAYHSGLDSIKATLSLYNDVEDFPPNSAWFDDLLNVAAYKASDSKQDERIESMVCDGLAAYLAFAERQPELTAAQRDDKCKATRAYTDGLIEKGGISTDAFKASLGEDTTRDFFEKVMFGTGRVG